MKKPCLQNEPLWGVKWSGSASFKWTALGMILPFRISAHPRQETSTFNKKQIHCGMLVRRVPVCEGQVKNGRHHSSQSAECTKSFYPWTFNQCFRGLLRWKDRPTHLTELLLFTPLRVCSNEARLIYLHALIWNLFLRFRWVAMKGEIDGTVALFKIFLLSY